MHGLSWPRRPLRLARTALRRLWLSVHDPKAPAEAITETIALGAGIRLRVDTYELVQRETYFVGLHPELRELLRRRLHPGDSAVDVGAHVGTYALLMAGLTPQGRVLACEPNPRLAGALREQAVANGLRNLTVVEAAVAAEPARATIHIPRDPRHVGGSSLGARVHLFLEDAEAISVEVTTIDALVERHGLRTLRLVKVDAEGFEPQVLKGAAKTLARQRPWVIFEYTGGWWHQAGFDLPAVLADLRQAGYQDFRRISWRGLKPLAGTLPDKMDVLAR